MNIPGLATAVARAGAALRPRRRRVAFVALVPLVAFVFAPVSGLSSSAGAMDASAALAPWWSLPVLVLSAVVAGLTLTTYVPAAGPWHRLAVGCSPCATAAGLTVVAALLARGSGPTDPVLAVVSLVILAAGLGHRLGDAGTCGVPALTAPTPSARQEEPRPGRPGPA